MKYIIKMADIYILMDVPYLLHQSASMTEFLFPYLDQKKSDVRMTLLPVEKLPVPQDIRYSDMKRIYVSKGDTAGIYFVSSPGRPPYAYTSRSFVNDGQLICKYLLGNERKIEYARNLITLMDIEATLLDFNALILHASFIRWHDMGIIFSAPSGTGKSTQADLWVKYQGAEVLNGDRAALRKVDGLWRAYGLPYAGTSGIYRNESAPLKAIVALRQAKENRIREIKGAEAFRYLYPETMIHRWDPDFERRATDLLLQLIGDIPVYLLECLPDEGAVKLLHDTVS